MIEFETTRYFILNCSKPENGKINVSAADIGRPFLKSRWCRALQIVMFTVVFDPMFDFEDVIHFAIPLLIQNAAIQPFIQRRNIRVILNSTFAKSYLIQTGMDWRRSKKPMTNCQNLLSAEAIAVVRMSRRHGRSENGAVTGRKRTFFYWFIMDYARCFNHKL
jgi:hypothetical protein